MKKMRLWLKAQAPIFGDVLMGFGISALAGEYSQLIRGEAGLGTVFVVLSATIFIALGAALRQGGDDGRA